MRDFQQFALSVCLSLFFVGSASLFAEERAAPLHLDHDPEQGVIAVMIRGEHFTTYHYGETARTPFLWPINGEGGVGLTRNFPMEEDQPRSTDHPHHRSLFLTFGDVNGYDHWHNERIETKSVETGVTDNYAWIRARNHWLDGEGKPLLEENQEIRFFDTPAAARFMEIRSTLVAAYGEVTFGDDKEGLLAIRIRPEIQGNRRGVLTNAEGRQGERNVYGTPSKWMDYSGDVRGHGVRGIALFDHPGNFRHPPAWHVRDYGLAAANPFGMRSVAGKSEDGSHLLEEGESLSFVYGIYVHSGDVKEARVAERYQEFADGEVRER